MTLIEKLKLIFKSAKPAGQFIGQIKGARFKWKTVPFWISVLGSAITLVASLQGFIPATVGVIIVSVLTAAYNIVRGLDKTNQTGVKPVFMSTEFWIGVAGILSTMLIDIQTAGVSSEVLRTVQSVLAAIMAIAQNVGANQPAVEPPKP